jgi:MFS family permease
MRPYGLGIGLGVGCSYVPAVSTVPHWFARRRGFASGIASSGIGFGTLIVPPLASLLITHVGWRETYLILGVLAVIAGVTDCPAFARGASGIPLREPVVESIEQGRS